MAIFALVAVAACAFAAGVCFAGGASDWADAETTWKTAIDSTTRKRAGVLTILVLKDIPPGARDSVMQKNAGMSRRMVPATIILHLASVQSKVGDCGTKELNDFIGWSCQSLGLADAMMRP